MGYLYIVLTILLTVYGQIVVKWQVVRAGALPTGMTDRFHYFLQLVMTPWVISAFAAAFLAAVSWMAAMTKFDLSYAYPFMSASFVLVFICSIFLFSEPVTAQKVVGLGMIVLGIIISSR